MMPETMRMRRRTLLGAAALSFSAVPTLAQGAYPSRPIRLILANSPGGSGDAVTRIIGDRLTTEIGTPVLVEARPGAATVIGTNYVAKAEPDGYTLLSVASVNIIQTVIRKQLPYDLMQDFMPIIGVGSIPLVLVAAGLTSIRSLEDLRTASRTAGGITYGSGGAGTIGHIAAARLLSEIGGRGTHVPFRGNAEVLHALAGGHVQIMFASVAEVPPMVAAGQLYALSVTSPTRLASLPQTPTMSELGFVDFEPSTWYGFLAPAKTSPAIVTRLSEAFARALADAAVREKLRGLSLTVQVRGPDDFMTFMRHEADVWGKVIRDNGLSEND